MRRMFAGMLLAGVLAACGQASSPVGVTTEESAPAGGYAAMDSEQERTAQQVAQQPAVSPAPEGGEQAQPASPPQQPNAQGGPAPVLYLAYTYGVGLELPSTSVSSVMDAHIQGCLQAGPRLCQLIGSNKTGDPESSMGGFVQLRGEPNWLRAFMGGLAAQAEANDGRITSQTVNSEDLTRNIVDTEARLRATRTLRDRLQRLLDSRPGRLSDLLEVERELARVQGELDATESALAVMRTRVSMSELTLNYTSKPRSVGSDTFRPLRDALAGFLSVVVVGFAAIITIIAGLIPFAVVIVPIVWGILAWRRRRGGRLFNRQKPPPAADPPGATGS
ncbi:DUF4349 domain-containing protein [Terricaulis sp.]|uniref:DUF4349 domain-containing protein n=1 Tax=Terricaulis sp. TaxID=2768686 RepID=UPI0037832A30